LSAAEQERREEDKRRRERIEDVVPGKTSAIKGATDYSIDIDSTRDQFLRQASRVEREIYQQTELGMEMIRMLRLDEASKAFDRVFELKPNAYLWQAGIVRFYLGDLDGALEIFTRCASIYETRFDDLASEERIWRNACLLKKLSTMNRTDRKHALLGDDVAKTIVNVPINGNFDASKKVEGRKVIRIALELFQSSIDNDLVSTVLSRAKLKSIGGSIADLQPTMDMKLWKISSWYFLGLHYDATGNFRASKECMKAALRLCPNSNSADLIHTLPMLHMSCRNWFDDEAFELDSNNNRDKGNRQYETEICIPSTIDPIVYESIRSSLEEARFVDLQRALRSRGLRVVGSKLELQSRLLDSLIDDAENHL
jgi:tetratricopeptide (TPR) repeat protein